jgi:hypothetical protein
MFSGANLTDVRKCRVTHAGTEYRGPISKTASGFRCQFWDKEYNTSEVICLAYFLLELMSIRLNTHECLKKIIDTRTDIRFYCAVGHEIISNEFKCIRFL